MVLPTTFEEVERALDVDLTIGKRSFDGGADTSQGCQMNHQLNRLLLEQALEQLVLTDIALPAYYASGCSHHGEQPLDILLLHSRGIKIIEIIQACYPVPLCPQSRTEMRPNKSCSSCYKNVCHYGIRQEGNYK